MARQVVSYDDLEAPVSSLDTAPTGSGNTFVVGVDNVAAGSNRDLSSPASKKRRRGEADGNTSTSQSVCKRNHSTGENTGIIADNPTSMSSFQAVPPRPQVKKRRNKRRPGGGSNTHAASSAASLPVHHWDDPGAQADGISYDEGAAEATADDLDEYAWNNDRNGGGDAPGAGEAGEDEEENEEDESRELTHEEIWDDSALIQAWDAANEEYEAIHGKIKRWKKDRVHKSPLWYNIPSERPVLSPKDEANRSTNGLSSAAEKHSLPAKDEVTDSSKPLNFETFVPTHDPSLAFPNPPHPPSIPQPTLGQMQNISSQFVTMLPSSLAADQYGSGDAPTPSVDLGSFGSAKVSADEAFTRALGAMYWCGYWTAMYHVQRAHEQESTFVANDVGAETLNEVEEEETAELVSTQR